MQGVYYLLLKFVTLKIPEGLVPVDKVTNDHGDVELTIKYLSKGIVSFIAIYTFALCYNA